MTWLKRLLLEPSIVLIDIRMLTITGIDAIKAILRHGPKAGIIVLTMSDGDDLIMQGIRLYAEGFIG